MNAFRYALRFLGRQKTFTVINMLGLALSLACCIILTRYLYREATVEKHCIDPSTIIVPVEYFDATELYQPSELTFYRSRDDIGLFSHVLEECKFSTTSSTRIKADNEWISATGLSAEPAITGFFRIDVTGDASALMRPDACWITRELAQRLYGDTDPTGMTLNVESDDYTTFTVAGIIGRHSFKTILNPDIILPYSEKLYWKESVWMRVENGFDVDELKKRCIEFASSDQLRFADHHHNFELWTEMYYKYKAQNSVKNQYTRLYSTGNRFMNRVLWATNLLILVIGLLNFINLFWVYWQYRVREEGIRKVFGQTRRYLFTELWTENGVLAAASVLLAWIIVLSLSGRPLEYLGCAVPFTRFDICLTVGIILFLPLIALLYPYVMICRKPVSRILASRSATVHESDIRNWILGVQYFITFTLLVCSLWLRSHLLFLMQSDTGIPVDEILVVPNPTNGYANWERRESDSRELVNQLRKSQLVSYALFTDNLPVGVRSSAITSRTWANDRGDENFHLNYFTVTPEWFNLFGIKILDGSLSGEDKPHETTVGIAKEFTSTYSRYDGSIVALNSSAMRMMGYVDAHQRKIGEEAVRLGIDPETHENLDHLKVFYDFSITLCAEIEDFYQGHRTAGVAPSVFKLQDERFNSRFLAVRVMPGKQEEALELVRNTIKDVCGTDDIECRWLRQDVDELYTEDRKVTDIFTVFSLVAVIVSLLGLLGIANFSIRQRLHEVAVRKVHGAKRLDLYLLLGRRTVSIMTAAFLFCIPVTILLIKQYTRSFIESAHVTVWIYLAALAIVLAVTVLTLATQLERACRLNPADVIKSE